MLGREGINVAHTLLLEYLIYGNENTCLLDIAESIVDSCTKKLHSRTQSHVGIDQWRYVVSQSSYLTIEDAVIGLEVVFCEQPAELLRVVPEFERLHGIDEVIGVGEVFIQEIENHVACHAVIAGVHGELAEEVAHRRLDDNNGAKSVPEIVERKDSFPAAQCTLVLHSDETTAQFNGPGSVVAHEAFGEAEHVARGKDGLSVGGYLPILAQDVTVSANYFFCLRVPHEDLLVAVFASVEFIQVETFACAAACCTECYLAQTADFAHHMRRILPCDNINFIAALVGHAQPFVRCEFSLQHLCRDGICDLFHYLVFFHIL